LAYTYAWDSLTFLTERYGEEALVALVLGDRQGRDLAENFETITGQALEDFMQEWNDSLWNGYAPEAWVDLAYSFDGSRAMAIVEELASDAYGGRLGGSPQATLAAEYIAAQFEELNLIPLGNYSELQANGFAVDQDQAPEGALEPPVNSNPYFQYYTRPFINMLYQPEVTFNVEFEDGAGFEYRIDFVLPDNYYFPTNQAVSGEIVWVQGYNDAIDLTGGTIRCAPIRDQDVDGWTTSEGDCDDLNDTVYPGAPSLCDGLNNDCTGGSWLPERSSRRGWNACSR